MDDSRPGSGGWDHLNYKNYDLHLGCVGDIDPVMSFLSSSVLLPWIRNPSGCFTKVPSFPCSTAMESKWMVMSGLYYG